MAIPEIVFLPNVLPALPKESLMKKSAFIITSPVFGNRSNSIENNSRSPIIHLKNGELFYSENDNGSCIEQEFKGRHGYLHSVEITLKRPATFTIVITMRDIFAVYPLHCDGEHIFLKVGNTTVLKLRNKRAAYTYLPPGEYTLNLPRGNSHIFSFYFDVGIFNGIRSKNYKFLSPLIDAHHNNSVLHEVSADFLSGSLTENYIRSLCGGLQKGVLNNQSFLLSMLVELIELSSIKMSVENDGINMENYHTLITKRHIKLGVQAHGITYNIDSISEIVPMSLQHLNHLFKVRYKMTMRQYKYECVIERATTYLLHGMAVWKITLQCGFEDARTFRRVFKRYTGMSPLEYRKAREKR